MQRLQTTIWLLAVLQRCGAVSAATLPTTLGPFSPAMLTTQLIDYAHNVPFAPSEDVPRALGISIFYPTAINTTVATSYWPPENAAEESEANFDSGVNTTYDGLLSLTVPLAPPNASIAASPANSSAWPVLLFSPAFGDTRFLYTSLLRQISSNGFVVIAFDTAYDTNVFVLANGTVIQGNRTLALSDSFSQERATTSAEARAQDASFILDHAHDNITSLIPGCNDICMNTTNVGMFGHSIGGAATALAMLADSRMIGGLNYDGAFLGPVVQKGLHRPFAIFGTQNQSRHNPGPLTTLTNWTTTWPRIKDAPKWWLLLNNSRHYTFSDSPLLVQKLGVKPNDTSLEATQLTDTDAERTEKVLVTYTVAFFKSVFTGKVQKLMKKKKNKKWPEVIFDSVDLGDKSKKGGNGTDAQLVDSGSMRQFECDTTMGVGMVVGMVSLAMFLLGEL